ncbi:extracellular membrane associated with a signal peptide [Cryptosporidium bovis]|uniref:extracellular membrane associated with a signal peptide n=1 Tax=Cryptosporidium bovis TaxID=310047 RepID=UPI00351A68F3|nr:extracellular membrane associated with a signal peptide [Cryptosporidium bovis]
MLLCERFLQYSLILLAILWNIVGIEGTTENNCPIGYIKKEDSCILCPEGTYSNSETGECDPCGVGKYSFPGSYSRSLCFDCPIGFYSGEEKVSFCKNCPDLQITDGIGATSLNDCYCFPGYKEKNLRDGACIQCNKNEWCYQSHAKSGGFWNVASYCLSIDLNEFDSNSLTNYLCSDKSILSSKPANFLLSCYGKESQCESLLRNDDLINDNNVDPMLISRCTEGNTGILCDSCSKGYAKFDGLSTDMFSCQKCKMLNYIPTLCVHLFIFCLIMYTVWLLRLEPTANEEEMPIVQVTLIRIAIQHVQLLSLLLNFKIVQFEYEPKLSVAFSAIASHFTTFPMIQCLASALNIDSNSSKFLNLFSIITVFKPILFAVISLIVAPILRYFRERELSGFLLGRQEMEGECIYFQKSYFSWFFSFFIVTYFFYFSSILQNLMSILFCVSYSVDINNPTHGTTTSNSDPQIPGKLLLVNIAKENICWSSDHKLSILIAAVGILVWIILVPAIYSICISVDKNKENIKRRRLVYGWWVCGYETSGNYLWDLFTTWKQFVYLIVIVVTNSFVKFNYTRAYFAVPGGSIYESYVPLYVTLISIISCMVMTLIFDCVYSVTKPHNKEVENVNLNKIGNDANVPEDELFTEEQRQKQRMAFGGFFKAKLSKNNWNTYYYFVKRISNFSILAAIFASIFPRLNVGIGKIISEKRLIWLVSTEIDSDPIGYNEFSVRIFSIFALTINYIFVFITIFSVLGIKIYRKITVGLFIKTKDYLKITSLSDFSDNFESITGNKVVVNNDNAKSNVNNPQYYHDMNKSKQIGDKEGEKIDDEISIEQLLRMHLRTDCLGFLTHEDRVSIVVAIKRCVNRQEGVAIALRATLDSRFGLCNKYTHLENIAFVCGSLRSYGFSDPELENLIEDLAETQLVIANRIKVVTKNIVRMTLDLSVVNYPEVSQKVGLQQIVPPELNLNLIGDNNYSVYSQESPYLFEIKKLVARLSMNGLILDISDVYFRIQRSIPLKAKLKVSKGTGLLFSETQTETSEKERMEFPSNKRSDENTEFGYKVPIPCYVDEEYNEPRSLDVDLMLSIKKLTEGDPRVVLEETNYPFAFEKATKYTEISTNKALEKLFALIGPEMSSNMKNNRDNLDINELSDNNDKVNINQDEELIHLLLGLNPDENIGTDAIITLLKDYETVINNTTDPDIYLSTLNSSELPLFKTNSNNLCVENSSESIESTNNNKSDIVDNFNKKNKDLRQIETRNKMSPYLKNSIYNLYLLRVLDLKVWLGQYRKQYLEEANRQMENIKMNNYLDFNSNMLYDHSGRTKNKSSVSSSSYQNNQGLNQDEKKHEDKSLVKNQVNDNYLINEPEIKENLKMMSVITSNLNRYASPSMLFYYLQLCKRLKIGADISITSLIPDNLLDKGVADNDDAIRLYREISPSLNLHENPNGFDIATLHEFSALNTPNINLKRELELTIELQREFNMIFPSAVPCIHSIFWVPFDIYDDDNLWILEASDRQNMIQLLELISKDHPQLVELPYVEEELIEEKIENVEFDSSEKSLVRQTINTLLPQISSNGEIESGKWLWSELPLRFAIDLNGLSIKKLYCSSNYPKSIFLSGNPLSVLGPQSPQWAFISHKSERINYMNGVSTINNSYEHNNGDSAIIIAPGIEVKGTPFTIEVWVKLPQLPLHLLDDNNETNNKEKIQENSSHRSKSRKKKVGKSIASEKRSSINHSLNKLQKNLGLKFFKDNEEDEIANKSELDENNVENSANNNDKTSNVEKKQELPTLHVLCGTDSMEGLFTVHRETGTIGFWDSNGRFLKCTIKHDKKDKKSLSQNRNDMLGLKNIATLQGIYDELGLKKKSTYCREINRNIEKFINFDEDPNILDPWVLIHIVYNLGSIKYYVNGKYIGSIRKTNGLRGDIAVIGGGLESGSNWGYFSQFRLYGAHTSNEQIKKRYESYVSLNIDSSFVTRINKLTNSTINWALTLWRSGAVGFFLWKYSNINLKSDDVTYLIDLINRKGNVLYNGEIVSEEDNHEIDEYEEIKGKNTERLKNGILLFGIIIRILKGERSFPYYYVYEPLPYIEDIVKKSEDQIIDTNNYYTKVKYKMTSITSQLGYTITEDYKNIRLDDRDAYRMNPLVYQPNIVPGPGMSDCLLLAFNTKSNNSGLLITPPIEIQKKINKSTGNLGENSVNVSELYSGWAITIWFHYPLLSNSSYVIKNNIENNLTREDNINNSKRKSNSDIDQYIVLVTGKSDSHIIINDNMDVGVYKNFSKINKSENISESTNITSSNNIESSINSNADKGFYPSGLNLNKANLPIGWHMMSVVGRPRITYSRSDNNNRNMIGGGGIGYTEISLPMQKNSNIITKYKWCQEFYVDGQIMGISSYCTHEDVLMIGNSLFLENSFGIFTCPRIYNRSFSPLEIHTDFLSYNYLIKASSWNSRDDILMDLSFNQIVSEFQVLENPSKKIRYLYADNNELNSNYNNRLFSKEKKNKRRILYKNERSEINERSYWLDEMEYQSPLYNYVETFITTNDNVDEYVKNTNTKIIPIKNNDDDNIVNIKNNGLITLHRGPTNENVCVNPTQIFMLEKKTGYSSEGGSIKLDKSIRLSKNWTCEVWVYLPFEITYHPYCLLSNNEGIGFIVIGLNGELGSIQKRVDIPINNTGIGDNDDEDEINNTNERKIKENKFKKKTNNKHFMSWNINIRDFTTMGWYHVVIVFNSTQSNTITTYVNSQCIGKKENLLELPHHQSPWIDCIGNLKSNKGNYIAPFGLFGHLKIYDFALSNIEVGLLYKNWLSHKNLKTEILNHHIKQEKSSKTKKYTLSDNSINNGHYHDEFENYNNINDIKEDDIEDYSESE